MKDNMLQGEIRSQFPLHLLGYAVSTGFPVAFWILTLGHFGFYHRTGNPYYTDAILFGGSTIGIMAMIFLSMHVFLTTDWGMKVRHWWLRAVVKREMDSVILPFFIAKIRNQAKIDLAEEYANELDKRGIKVTPKEISDYVEDSTVKKQQVGAIGDFEE